jgi:hypothetical protein
MTPTPLADRILAAIARATSKRPSNADDVLALVGGKDVDFWAAIDQLAREGRITGAQLYRPRVDAGPWLGIWPTGVIATGRAWTGSRLSFLFVRHDPVALKKTGAPRSRPRKSAAKEA